MNNVYLCFLPAHTSHGLQPLDNGVFNAVKAAYKKELSRLAVVTDARPVDKVNFIRCYAAARAKGMTRDNIISGFRVTGNWPISRYKALHHDEIQADESEKREEATPEPRGDDEAETPRTGRQILDMSKWRSPSTRSKYRRIAKAFDRLHTELVLKDQRIADLEARIETLQPKRKRKKIPNPNKKFMTIGEIGGQIEADAQEDEEPIGGGDVVEVEEIDEVSSAEEEIEVAMPEPVLARSGRTIRRPSRYSN